MTSFCFKLFIILIILNCHLFSNGIDTLSNPSTTSHYNNEVGVALGNPSGINLLYTYHFNDFLLKASGNYLGELRGGQIDFGYKIYSDSFTYLAFTIAGGSSRYPKNNNIFGTNDMPGRWDYYSINTLFNTRGFFVSLGLSEGNGTLSSPRVNLQVGISYQF